MGSLIALSKPEGGAEREVVFAREHRCPQGNALRNSIPEVDLLVWPVGISGWEIPNEVPFDVTAPEPCGACGAVVACWFIWKGPQVIEMESRLWTPGED